jgi:hypothetical protein
VNSERELRTELRRALDDVLPPVPWLEAAVIEDLHRRRLHRSAERSPGKSQHRRTALPRAVIQLAAVLLVVVLAAVATATFLELRYHAPQSTPAGLDPKVYQAMVSRDVNHLDSAGDGTSCATLQSTCPMPGRPVLAALQRWLVDLNGSEPPATFAVIDAQLRSHLTATISVLNAVVSAYQARDQTGLDRANYALQRQSEWLDVVAGSIVSSYQGTVAGYRASVRAAKQNFNGCTACQLLVSTSQVDCTQVQNVSCQSDVFDAMSTIGPFEATVVRYAAPSSLAAQDRGLQLDLAQADTAVLDLANAEMTGDQTGFNTSRPFLQQVLPAIDADIAAILGG